MNTETKRLFACGIAITLLVGGTVGAIAFVKTKPQAERKRRMSSMVSVVETMPLVKRDQPLVIECLGTVISDQDATLQAQVSGRIMNAHQNLVEGELVKKGDILLEIQAIDYELALSQAEADLLTAQSNMRIEEGQQDIVRNELELMGSKESDSYRDLILREPQLKSAEAAVKSAELAVESAKLDLDRTKIRAPFDAVIVSVNAHIGDYAQTSETLIELAATGRYFVRSSVPLSALTPLPKLGAAPYSAEVILSDGSSRKATTHRLMPNLSDTGRMARILMAVDAPFNHEKGRPMLLNEVVRVKIVGETATDATLIPRKYLRDGQVIWMIDSESKLRVLPVELLQGYASEVLIRVETEPGMELITSDLAASIEGMDLRRVGEKVAQPEKRGPRTEKQGERPERKGSRPEKNSSAPKK